MTLPWVRLETGFPDNPKILGLVGAGQHRAALAYVCSLAWCGRHETDGFIPRAALTYVHARPSDAQHLVTHKLWRDCGEGWLIPDWEDYQRTKHTNDTIKAGKRRAACQRWHPQPCDRCT